MQVSRRSLHLGLETIEFPISRLCLCPKDWAFSILKSQGTFTSIGKIFSGLSSLKRAVFQKIDPGTKKAIIIPKTGSFLNFVHNDPGKSGAALPVQIFLSNFRALQRQSWKYFTSFYRRYCKRHD